MSTVDTVRVVLALQKADSTVAELAKAATLSKAGVRDMLARLMKGGFIEFKRWRKGPELRPGPATAVYGWKAAT